MGEPRNVILIGFMGSGKSDVGERLARALEWSFIDMDDEIERREGRSISDIFASDGEARFRRLESELAAELGSRTQHVIATGGGVIQDADNIAALGENGLLVYLHADIETLLERILNDPRRPLASGPNAETELRERYTRRAPLYEAAGERIETSGKTPSGVVDTILDRCRLKS